MRKVIELAGPTGNAFYILGVVRRAMQGEGRDPKEIDRVIADATAGDYEHLKAVCEPWCEYV